jgi:leucyl-tRNA synthetase
MEYNFREIEQKWQQHWADNKTYKAIDNSEKNKYYVLDMFPYPSGAGLHVGHPLGYIASDIMARFKRHKGYNVLHPMGYDSFGLPAEQYAIQTGQHPAITTEINIDGCLDEKGNIKEKFLDKDGNIKKEALNNEGHIIKGYRKQLDQLGLSFDWDREVRTSDPNYYKWTQWIFIQLFNSWYNPESDKAEAIETLIEKFKNLSPNPSPNGEGNNSSFSIPEILKNKSWNELSEKEQSDLLMEYRLAYLSEAYVNWCPALGTVLANDEVKDGVSERGGHPVERKLMKQWSLRITAYAERLLKGLDIIDWSESIKEAQRNWIGRSEGTSLKFEIDCCNAVVEVFTTRPDTIFGVSYLTLAPEHELVEKITNPEQKEKVDAYITYAKNRSERERQADVKKVTGEFTGAYAIHPFTGKQIPIWVGDYVLAGYGTGAVMAVPGHDTRDYAFAKTFNLPILQVVEGGDLSKEAYDAKEGKIINSDFLNGLEVKDAIKAAIAEIEKREIGKGKINYRLRDAVFGRQRYWGEPIPVYYKDLSPNTSPKGEENANNLIPCVVDEKHLPIILPEVDKYLPTEDGEPPLARADKWYYDLEKGVCTPPSGGGAGGGVLEFTTMPGWAGSSWYFLRYMDPKNEKEFVSKKAAEYWKEIDLYIGGAEHATGHLLYFRFWTKFLKDLGYISIEEPAKKLINQGMINGVSKKIICAEGMNVKSTHTEILTETNEHQRFHLEKVSNTEKVIFVSSDIIKEFGYPKSYTTYNIPIDFFDENNNLDINKLIEWRQELKGNSIFITKEGWWNSTNKDGIQWTENRLIINKKNQTFFYCLDEVEKMSKSKWNVVNPDDIVRDFGADTLRLYEMFLGPLEQHKPWNTNGITGVHNFLKKLWRLFHTDNGISNEAANKAELKALHKCIKKVNEDIERFSFNTSVSNFMICVNELSDLKCNKREILEPIIVLISPYAPHIAEELWSKLGHTASIEYVAYPVHNEAYLTEDNFNYPVSFNGKMRFNIELPITLSPKEVEEAALAAPEAEKWLEGKTPKKVIVVPKKIVNIVV